MDVSKKISPRVVTLLVIALSLVVITTEVSNAQCGPPQFSGPTTVCGGSTWTYSVSGTGITSSSIYHVGNGTHNGSGSVTWLSSATSGTVVFNTNCGMFGVNVTITPAFAVSGGGTICTGGSANVTLAGSQTGVTYSLYRNGTTLVSSLSGTGSALTWSQSTAGTYIVRTTSCTMAGAAPITTVAPPIQYTVSGGGVVCDATTSLPVTLSNSEVGVVYQLRNNGSSDGPAVIGTGSPITWNRTGNIGSTYNFSVSASRMGCTNNMLSYARITASTNPSILTVTDNNTGAICAGGSGATITLQGATEANVSYQLKVNGIASGAAQMGTGANLTWTAQTLPGNYTVAADKAGCVVTMNGSPIVTDPLPTVFNVTGNITLCPGNVGTVYLDDSEIGINYQLVENNTTNVGSPVAGTSGPLTWTRNTPGINVYTVRATSAIGGCIGMMNGSATITLLAESAKKTEDFFTHSLLSATTPLARKLYLNRCDEVNGICKRDLKKLKVHVKFDLGDVFKWGNNTTFSGQSGFTLRLLDGAGAELFTSTAKVLTISKTSPEQLYYYEETNVAKLAAVREVEVLPAPGYIFTGALNTNDIRLKFWYEEEFELSVASANISLIAPTVIAGNPWERLFSWTVNNVTKCQGIKNYQVQVMRWFGSSTPLESDWLNGLSMETGSAATTIKLVLAEGSGLTAQNTSYKWRVRALGSLPGGITNPENWGPWSATGTISDYTQPDENKNWMFSRVFTEGNQISESLTYANGLQQVSQRQIRLQSMGSVANGGEDQLVATQTLRDFVGRDALTTLPIPVPGVSVFGYRSTLLRKKGTTTPYSTVDFDENPYDALKIKADVEGGYYSDIDQTVIDGKVPNDRVADPEGFPYTRTLFTKDGTGRVREQGGVGGKNSLLGGKTVRTFYTGASEGEMVRLFGNEAPETGNVQKIVTVDANGTASITYQNKDGKVLATALDAGVQPSNLIGLSTRPDPAAFPIFYEEVKDETRFGMYGSSSKKPLLFPSSTTVYVDYTLTPQAIASLCNSACQTCDYTIDFILYNQDLGIIDPQVSQTRTISSGSCTSITPTVIPQFSFIANGNTNYVLEKRVTANNLMPSGTATYMDDYISQRGAALEAAFNAGGSKAWILHDYLNNKNLAGLYSYLTTNGTFDATLQQYSLPLTVNGCAETLYIPKEEICANAGTINITSTNPCQSNATTLEAYFNNYWGVNGENKGYLATGSSGVLYFTNKYRKWQGVPASSYQQKFSAGDFNTMVNNMLVDNPLLTCTEVWDIWESEVANYEDYSDPALNMNGNVEWKTATGSVSEAYTFENNLFDRFMNRINQKLAEKNPDPTGNCTPGTYYFIQKSLSYVYGNDVGAAGQGSGAMVNPDLTRVYKYIYYNSGDARLVTARGKYMESVGKSGMSFMTLTNQCEIYKFAQLMDLGQYERDGAPEQENRRHLVINNCKETCEGRREEFKQAVINKIFTQNPSATIEHYFVSKFVYDNTGTLYKYVGSYDLEYNPVTPTYTECQLDAMTEALVRNCQTKYCSFTFNTVNGQTQLGTTAELDNSKKAMSFNFDVQVNASGSTCAAGWDQISGGGPYDSNKFGWALRTTETGNSNGIIRNDKAGNQYILRGVGNNSGGSLLYKLEKYMPSGTMVWSKSIIFSSTGGIYVYDMEIDSNDNAIVSGYTNSSTVDFNYGVAGGEVSGSYQYFIAKYSSTGIYSWSKMLNIGWVEWMQNNQIEIDAGNNIILVGDYARDVDFDPSSGTYTLSAPDGNDVFFAKYDQNGNFLTAKRLTDEFGAFNYLESDGLGDYFLLYRTSSATKLIRYNSNMSVVTEIKISGIINGGQLALDYENSIYVVGTLSTNADLDPGLGEYLQSGPFFAKYTSYGSFVWSRTIDSEQNLHPDICIRSDGRNLYIYGKVMWGIMDLDPSPTHYSFVNSPNNTSTFLIKCDLNGMFKGGMPLMNAWGYDVNAFDQNVYVIGSLSSTTDFDPSDAIYNLTGTASNLFVAKYGLAQINCNFWNTNLCFQFTTARSATDIPVNYPPAYIYNPTPVSCVDTKCASLLGLLDDQISNIIERRKEEYRALYVNACVNPLSLNDKFIINYKQPIHHFTLYYYDRAGNLIRTVPPEGTFAEPPVNAWGTGTGALANPASLLKDVSTEATLASSRLADTNYRLVTEYQYNSIGQLIRQHTPDGNGDPAVDTRPLVTATESVKNASKYYNNLFYDDQGRLRFSQNAQQKADGTFSYTKYDALSRVIEVGLASGYVEATLLANRNTATYPNTGTTEITATFYSTAYSGGPALPAIPNANPAASYLQRYLRNRVSYVYTDNDGLSSTNDRIYSIYSYDPHGNVEWLIQGIPDMYTAGQHAMIAITYEYDLLTGNMKKVCYNPGREDQFYHLYAYDADKRIKTVMTSRDGRVWDKDARYTYYPNGPLKRAVLGEDKVQGIDYTYTIQGWLKATNAPWSNTALDPGLDGANLVATRDSTALDAFAMQLGYYAGDFQHKLTASTYSVFDNRYNAANNLLGYSSGQYDLYNGNISTWMNYQVPKLVNAANTNNPKNSTIAALKYDGITTGDQYRYDELNRIAYDNLQAFTGTWLPAPANGEYYSGYTYRPNGNLIKVDRNADTRTVFTMDQMTYSINAATNRLNSVVDASANTGTWSEDLDAGQAANNYTYDAIGNLKRDNSQSTDVTWNVYGKVKTTTNTPASSSYAFSYDASGNRVIKKNTRTGITTTHYYVRDAQGNTLAVYKKITDTNGTTIKLDEVGIHGSERLGTYTSGQLITATGPVVVSLGATGSAFTRALTYKNYELTDHLGNVRAIVSDQREAVLSGSTVLAYKPELKALYNYYPFGMEQPQRNWESTTLSKYNYGYNGKERDDDSEFGMTNYDYGFRIYNPAIARFLSVDPLTPNYPSWSPYPFAMNRPIDGVDLDGLEWKSEHKWTDKITDKTHIEMLDDDYVEGMTYVDAWRVMAPPILDDDIGNKIDCADLAIRTLVHFAFDFKLTIHFQDYKSEGRDPTFNNNNFGFTNTDGEKVVFEENDWQRLSDNIMAKYGAPDLFNNRLLTTDIPQGELEAGDLMVWKHPDGGGYHAQTLTDVWHAAQEYLFGLIVYAPGYTTIQGNLNGGEDAPAREKTYTFEDVNSRKGETIKPKKWNFAIFDSNKPASKPKQPTLPKKK